MTIDEVYQLGESSKKLEEEVRPSFGDTFKAALRTSVTGATTAFDTIERKHVMPSNEGEDNYYNTQEFKDIISKEAPKISVTELSELYDAKNANYLRAKIQNQKNYLGAIDTIEKAGGTGMAVEVATSLADLPSWLVGGVIFKGAKVAKTALDINKAGAKMLYDIGTGGLAAGTAVTASEAMIQGEAGVQLNDRLENTAMYGTAFGLALPAIAHTISGVAQGGARQSIANNLNTLIDNVPGSGSLRGLFSVSSADQALYKTDNSIVNDWGARSTTRSSAAKDANGNFVTATNDTAMNYKDTLIDSSLSTVGASMAENSKRFGIAFDKINEEDGQLFHQFANSVDQTVGREVALLDEASLIQQYKQATGITELPHETKLASVTAKYDKMVNEAEAIYQRDIANIQTQKQSLIDARLQQVNQALEPNALNSITKEVDKEFKDMTKLVEKNRKKSLKDAEKFKEKNAITRDDLPEDLYDVVISHNKTKMFDDGRLVVPERLKYLEDFFVKFGKEATDHELRGIAGKESRGYIHTMWNTDAILADLQGSKAKIQEMLLDDELTKARLARNEITLEEVAKKAEDMVNSISTKDFTRKFIDETRGVTSTSATKQKTMKVNKALYPELFVTNVDSLASDYAERIGGKLALKKTFGIDSDKISGRLSDSLEKEYRRVAEEGKRLGHSDKHIKRDVANVKAIAETILGVNRYQHNPHEALATTARLLKKGSSALYSAGFVKYAIIEPTVAIMRYGLKNTLKQYVPAIKLMQEHINSAKPNDPLVKVMRQAGLAVNTLRALKYDRFNNFDATASRSKGEMFLDKMSHISRKYSGFNYINDINDYVAGGAALSELQEVMVRPHNLSNSEASRMARYGLSSDDLAKINNEAIIKDANGNVIDWNTDAWRDQELSTRFLRYLGSATRDTIMRADGTRVHRYQADANNILGSMAFQFTQMPTALYERVLLNMKDEVAARSFVGMFMATSFMYTILELEDMAKVKSGAKDARDSHEQLLTQAITRTPFVGILPNFIDAGLMLTGNAPLGSAYTPHSDLASLFLGAGYSTGNKALKALQGLGDGIDGTDASNMLKLVPILNSLPILSVGMKALEHDFKTDNGGVSDVSANYSQPLHNIFKEQ